LPAIEESIQSTVVTDPDEWGSYAEELRKHPDEQDLLGARMFAAKVLAKC